MVEQIPGKPIMTIPRQQILAGELVQLRRKWARLRKEEALKENERLQVQIIKQLQDMGRDDLY